MTRAGSSLGIFQLALDDRGHLVSGDGDGALHIWDRARPAPDNLLVTRRGHDASITSLEIRDDTALTFSRDQTVRQWAIPSGEPRGRAYVRFDSAAMSPNGLWIATVNTSPYVSLWDSAKARLLAQIPAAEPLYTVAFLDDDHVVAANPSGALEVIDVSGPPRSATEVIRRVGDSRRWRVDDQRVVERP